MIAEGRVALNGSILDTPATILRNLNGVTVDGDPVEAPSSARLFLYHKPTGLLVTERDPAGRTTIYDRLPQDLPRLVPVGRLDLNTEGLLLMTTDGGLKRQLELPATGVERAYRARAYGNITQPQLEELIEGIEIEGVRYGSINANIERRTGANVWIEMILTEGKNREVRRVLEHLGLQVSRLIRTRYGPFVLGDLAPGQIGEVLQHDVVAFQKELAKGKPEGPGARANIGISASAGAGAGIGARSSQRGSNAPRPAATTRPAPGARPVSGARPAVGSARTPVRSPYAAPASSGFSSGAVPTDRPSRPARPERIRPTAAMQRGDVNDPLGAARYAQRRAAERDASRPADEWRDVQAVCAAGACGSWRGTEHEPEDQAFPRRQAAAGARCAVARRCGRYGAASGAAAGLPSAGRRFAGTQLARQACGAECQRASGCRAKAGAVGGSRAA
ncbi:pseudouridine synthase [Sphingomonas sp. H160509]